LNVFITSMSPTGVPSAISAPIDTNSLAPGAGRR
jgi:hypothetical protein